MAEAAMNAVLQEAKGQNPTAALTAMRNAPTNPRVGGSITFLRNTLNINVPHETLLIAACKRVLIEKLDLFASKQRDAAVNLDREMRRYNGSSYAGSGGSTPPSRPTISPERSIFIQNLLAAQAALPKEGGIVALDVTKQASGMSSTPIQTYTIASTLNLGNLLNQPPTFVLEGNTPDRITTFFGTSKDRTPLGLTRSIPHGRTYVETGSGKESIVTFELREPTMVTAWIDGELNGSMSNLVDAHLSIRKGTAQVSFPPSIAGTQSTRSVSNVLQPGIYSIVLRNRNDEHPPIMTTSPLSDNLKQNGWMRLGIDFSFSPVGASIEGKVSLGNDIKPVRMRVAEFTKGDHPERRTDYSPGGVSVFDPSKPVIVVIHGMNSSEREVKINELTKALKNHPSNRGTQIATVDWNEAAYAFLGNATDAPWVTPVGQWVARTLMSLGFKPEQISAFGHSHGSFAAYEMGSELMKLSNGSQMNLLGALDPAGNPFWTGYDHTKINFANVSQRSVAFEIAWMTDSNKIASTADITFKCDAPTERRPDLEHGLGMTLFTRQLQLDATGTGGNLREYIGLEALSAFEIDSIGRSFKKDSYASGGEAMISIDVDWMTINHEDFPLTTPRLMKKKDPITGEEVTINSDLIK